jgi:phosphoribosylamine--glycine ligase
MTDSNLNVLLVGGGGREHALAWALAKSPSVERITVAPGNGGTEWSAAPGRAPSSNLAIAAENVAGLVAWAVDAKPDLTVIGPEVPLALGIVDALHAEGLHVFGPTQAAAQLEASKAFSKAFMGRHGIPTAAYGAFTDYEAARDFVEGMGKPVVIKADGLAAGKGVIVCDSADEADAALRRIMQAREFGAAGDRVIVEERLSGSEVSALAFSDGTTVAMMPPARDHKRIFDRDQGANTGGMGAYAPVPDLPPDFIETVRRTVIEPAVRGMAAADAPYVGVLYAGLMLTPDGVRVLEFNCRFGDPETQALLPLLDDDLAQIMLACIDGTLASHPPRWHGGSCATVVAAAPGYPGSYPKGLPISGLGENTDENVVVFHAGTAREGANVVTSGGRVLSVSARADTLPAALAKAYVRIGHIHFEGMHYRHDIGRIYEGMTR